MKFHIRNGWWLFIFNMLLRIRMFSEFPQCWNHVGYSLIHTSCNTFGGLSVRLFYKHSKMFMWRVIQNIHVTHRFNINYYMIDKMKLQCKYTLSQWGPNVDIKIFSFISLIFLPMFVVFLSVSFMIDRKENIISVLRFVISVSSASS